MVQDVPCSFNLILRGVALIKFDTDLAGAVVVISDGDSVVG